MPRSLYCHLFIKCSSNFKIEWHILKNIDSIVYRIAFLCQFEVISYIFRIKKIWTHLKLDKYLLISIWFVLKISLDIGQVVFGQIVSFVQLTIRQVDYWAKSDDSTKIRQIKHSSKMDSPRRDYTVTRIKVIPLSLHNYK